MPLINLSNDKNLEVRIKNLNTLKEKIYYLKKQEELIKRAHKNNLILIDLNPKNFIIDKNDNLIAIDTDNYIVNEYKNDIFPTYFYEYYTSKVSHNIDNNIDSIDNNNNDIVNDKHNINNNNDIDNNKQSNDLLVINDSSLPEKRLNILIGTKENNFITFCKNCILI